MLTLLANLERKGGLKVAIDSILLVVFPGSVGEVPDKMSRWDNKWKLILIFRQNIVVYLMNNGCLVVFVQKTKTPKLRDWNSYQ